MHVAHVHVGVCGYGEAFIDKRTLTSACLMSLSHTKSVIYPHSVAAARDRRANTNRRRRALESYCKTDTEGEMVSKGGGEM